MNNVQLKKQTRNKEKRYCNFCGNVFKTTFLQNHERIHTKMSVFNGVFLPLNDSGKKILLAHLLILSQKCVRRSHLILFFSFLSIWKETTVPFQQIWGFYLSLFFCRYFLICKFLFHLLYTWSIYLTFRSWNIFGLLLGSLKKSVKVKKAAKNGCGWMGL